MFLLNQLHYIRANTRTSPPSHTTDHNEIFDFSFFFDQMINFFKNLFFAFLTMRVISKSPIIPRTFLFEYLIISTEFILRIFICHLQFIQYFRFHINTNSIGNFFIYLWQRVKKLIIIFFL